MRKWIENVDCAYCEESPIDHLEVTITFELCPAGSYLEGDESLIVKEFTTALGDWSAEGWNAETEPLISDFREEMP